MMKIRKKILEFYSVMFIAIACITMKTIVDPLYQVVFTSLAKISPTNKFIIDSIHTTNNFMK